MSRQAKNTAAERPWQQFIDGSFVPGKGSPRQLFNASTGRKLCVVEDASPDQVEQAILSARKAFDEGPWPRKTALERSQFLLQVADAIDQHGEELTMLDTMSSGKPLRESHSDVADAANCFRYYAGLIKSPTGHAVDVPAPSVTQVVREPIGVCAQIIPWNFPLVMAAWKLAPALAAGNCCILKPSELTPFSVVLLADLMKELGLPDGVVNIVLGGGAVGNQLAQSNLVDKLAFTGSVATGKKVAAASLGNLKKVTLELGGKSPMVVFDDVDLDMAVDHALFAIFCNAGQVCSAGSRFIVHERVHAAFVAKLVERSKKIRVGSSFDDATEMGPLVSKAQMERVLAYIETGKEEGATLVCGGDRPKGKGFGKGYFVNPTIFTNVTPQMRIVKEEIFGPVAVVQKFSTEDEAIALANGTDFGLAAAVFTNDATRAFRVVKAIRAGITWINVYHNTYNECPWGGFKQSGWGRELGPWGLEAYTELKQISLNLDPVKVGWFAE